MEVYEFMRTELAIGSDNVELLKNKKVVVLGVGGVGSFSTESLARVGIGNLVLVDKDVVDITNINRQIHATQNTIGLNKVDIMRDRILSINPNCNVTTHKLFIEKENIKDIITNDVDYVIDAIDTVTAKLDVVEYCQKNNIKLICSLGTGNKLDPTQFQVADIYKTSVCPLAKVMRTELKKRGIKKQKVVFSKEQPRKIDYPDEFKDLRKKPPASIAFVPPVAGMILTSVVIRELIDLENYSVR